MEPITTALIATALGQGLSRLGEQLADKTVEPLLDTTAEKLRTLLPRLRKADDQALQAVVETALQAAGAPIGEEGEAVQRWLKHKSLDRLAYGYGATRLGLTTPFIPLQVRLADFARELAKAPALALDTYLFRAIEQQFPHPKLGEFL